MKGECRCGSIVKTAPPVPSEGMDRGLQPSITRSGVVWLGLVAGWMSVIDVAGSRCGRRARLRAAPR